MAGTLGAAPVTLRARATPAMTSWVRLTGIETSGTGHSERRAAGAGGTGAGGEGAGATDREESEPAPARPVPRHGAAASGLSGFPVRQGVALAGGNRSVTSRAVPDSVLNGTAYT